MMVSGMFSLLLYGTDFPLCIYIYIKILFLRVSLKLFFFFFSNFYSDSSPAFKTVLKTRLFNYL